MKLVRLLVTGALLGPPLSLVACDPGATPGVEDFLAGQDELGRILLQGDAQLRVAHAGTRVVYFASTLGPGLSFRESVVTDGAGRFSIVPLELLDSSVLDWDAFQLRQRAQEGFILRYRDFCVRDAREFVRGWRLTDLGTTVTVADRACRRYSVRRNGQIGAGTRYELSLEPHTGLILAYEQYDAAGLLLSSIVYETLDLAPDTSQVVWHQPSNQEQVLESGVDLSEQLGAIVLEPRLLPAGFRLHEAASVADGTGGRWVKLTYLDGVEPLLFMQRLPPPAGSTGHVATFGWSGEAVAGPEPGVVQVYQLGATTVAQGRVQGFDLIALGLVPEAEILDLIESALP